MFNSRDNTKELQLQSVTLTSKYPKIPELKSPAGKPIAIMFSVIYVMSKSNPPSYYKNEKFVNIYCLAAMATKAKLLSETILPTVFRIVSKVFEKITDYQGSSKDNHTDHYSNSPE